MSSSQYAVESSEPGKSLFGEFTAERQAGSWMERQFGEHGLADIAAAVRSRTPLTISQADLLTRAPVPLVLRLAEQSPTHVIEDLLRPVRFIPLAALLSENGSTRALEECSASIENALEQTPEKSSLHIAIDSWSFTGGRHPVSYDAVLQTLAALRERFAPRVLLIGPSTGELKSLIPESDSELNDASNVLRAFRDAGIERIEGGNDLKIHASAVASGLQTTFAHNLVRSRMRRGDDAPRPECRSFLEELFELRTKLFPAYIPETWYPWSSVVLDHGQPKQEAPLGFEVLFAIALARLCLPEVQFIRAPLSMIGPRMAEVALQFGANDLGYAAVDADTADQLGLVRWQIAVHELQYRK